jgi:phosphatidylglycerophosphate synthase
MPTEPTGRRPLKTRDWPFFKNLAAWLARSGATPNGISFASILFGCAAGLALAATSHVDGWALRGCAVAGAVFIQLRLIANLLDGMVAVEGRKGGPTGDLWNEAPDRISDAAIFIGAGYAAGSSPLLGMGAALVAVFVAYIRALGASVGAGQIFLGPMAKPHRMALVTVACLLFAVFPASSPVVLYSNSVDVHLHDTYYIVSGVAAVPFLFGSTLLLVIVGGIVTSIRRLRRIAAFLRQKQTP